MPNKLCPCSNACQDHPYQNPIELFSNESVYFADHKLKQSDSCPVNSRFQKGQKPGFIVNGQKPWVMTNENVSVLGEHHFHQEAEHVLDGYLGDAEAHFVYKNKQGDITVLAFVLRGQEYSPSFLDAVLAKVPFSVPRINSYFSVSGSLTSSPVKTTHWIISTEIVDVSWSCLQKLKQSSQPSKSLQSRNGRDIILAQHKMPSLC